MRARPALTTVALLIGLVTLAAQGQQGDRAARCWPPSRRRPSDLVFTGELDGGFLVLDGRDGAVLYRFNTSAR